MSMKIRLISMICIPCMFIMTLGISVMTYISSPVVAICDALMALFDGGVFDHSYQESLLEWLKIDCGPLEELRESNCTSFYLAEAVSYIYYHDCGTSIVYDRDYWRYLQCFQSYDQDTCYKLLSRQYGYSPSDDTKEVIQTVTGKIMEADIMEDGDLKNLGFEGSTGCTASENTYLPAGTELNERLWQQAYQIGGGNPFYHAAVYGGYPPSQCTTFAWFRFYQYYGYSCGATGNGKDFAYQAVSAHPDQFRLSRAPAPGALISFPATIDNSYGHVAFVEKVQGQYMWYSEGNYDNGGIRLNTKVNYEELRRSICGGSYCIAFAVKG